MTLIVPIANGQEFRQHFGVLGFQNAQNVMGARGGQQLEQTPPMRWRLGAHDLLDQVMEPPEPVLVLCGKCGERPTVGENALAVRATGNVLIARDQSAAFVVRQRAPAVPPAARARRGMQFGVTRRTTKVLAAALAMRVAPTTTVMVRCLTAGALRS